MQGTIYYNWISMKLCLIIYLQHLLVVYCGLWHLFQTSQCVSEWTLAFLQRAHIDLCGLTSRWDICCDTHNVHCDSGPFQVCAVLVGCSYH